MGRRLKAGAIALGVSVVLSASAFAGEVELAGWVGVVVPSYQQAFLYQPGSLPLPPGISVQQEGAFTLDAQGGVTFGGSLTWFFTGGVGLEARVDSAGVEVQSLGGRFDVGVRLPPPLPPINVSLESSGLAQLDRLTPISLNVKLRTPGRVRFVFSAGGSWLPSISFLVTQNVGLGVTGIGGPSGVLVPLVPLQAGGQIDSAFGVNAGAGLQVALAKKVSLVAEGRFFYFPKVALDWGSEGGLAGEISQLLGPIEFSPAFFQATAGIAVRF